MMKAFKLKRKCKTWLENGTFLPFSMAMDNCFFRIPQLDAEFEHLCKKQQNWPTPLANGADLYADFYHATHSLAKNIICASCGTIGYDIVNFHSVPILDASLRC